MKPVVIPLLLLATLSAVSLSGQVTLTLTGPATARPGTPVTLTLNAVETGGNPTIHQWQITPPAGYLLSVPTVGAAGTAGGKLLACTPDNQSCIEYGYNATVLTSGALATYTVTIPPATPAGTAAFPLSGMVTSSSTGTEVATSSGAAYSLGVLDYRDINGDGHVDKTDVDLMVQQVLASRANPAACVNDMNGDGKCNVVDVMIVLLKYLFP